MSTSKIKNLILVVGTPRSGTTLLQVMLSQLDGVFFPPETQFYMSTKRRRKLLGLISTDIGFRNTVNEILYSCKRNELPVDLKHLQAELLASEADYEELFNVLLQHIKRQNSCRRLGEKSPDHLRHANEILGHYQDAKLIVVIRDGRDSASSRKASFGTAVLRSAIVWKSDVKRYLSLKNSKFSNRILGVFYEDIVSDPIREMKKICTFIEEDYSEAMLDFHQRKSRGFADREVHKKDTLKALNSSSIGRYKRAMSRLELAVFQKVAGKELSHLNYELAPLPNWIWPIGLVAQVFPVVYEKLKFLVRFYLRRYKSKS